MLWGWLPCGLVYTVLLAAVVSGGALQGAAVMLAFGLGTLPSMLLASAGAARLGTAMRRPALRRAAGIAVVCAGLWTMALPLLHSSGMHDHGSQGETTHVH